MNYPWEDSKSANEASTSKPGGESQNVMLELDDRTLQCLVGAGCTDLLGQVESPLDRPPSQSGAASPSGREKRKHEEAAFSSWLSGKFGDEEEDPEESEDSRPIGRKGRPMSSAAVAKATREKARRERLNECFEELARLCDPTGRGVKTDRVSVVADAIRVMTQLRVENNQLRQLNKFLEERVAGYERARAQLAYQQSLLQQVPHVAALTAGSSAALQVGGSAGAVPSTTAADAVPAGAMPAPASSPFLHAEAGRATGAGVPGMTPTLHAGGAGTGLPEGFMVDPFAVAGLGLPSSDYSAAAAAAAVGMYPLAAAPLPSGGMLAPAPLKGGALGGLTGVELAARLDSSGLGTAEDTALSWLPAPNATEDSKLRPPAA